MPADGQEIAEGEDPDYCTDPSASNRSLGRSRAFASGWSGPAVTDPDVSELLTRAILEPEEDDKNAASSN
jgi:hypothetical protein